MVRIDKQKNILRIIFKLQDELKQIDDEEISYLSMTLQRSHLKSSIQKKLKMQKMKYYSLANDNDFLDTLTEDQYDKEMGFYELILPKKLNFNNSAHVFQKSITKNELDEDQDGSFEFQEMALHYLESANREHIGSMLFKTKISSLKDAPSDRIEYSKDKIVSCCSSNQNDLARNFNLRLDNTKFRFKNVDKIEDKKKLIVSKCATKPKENIATDSGEILETEEKQILIDDSEKILNIVDENHNKFSTKQNPNILMKRKFLQKCIEKHVSECGKTISNTFSKQTEFTMVKPKDDELRINSEFQNTNMQSVNVIEFEQHNDNTKSKTAPSEIQTFGKRSLHFTKQIEEKRRKLQNLDESNEGININKIEQLCNMDLQNVQNSNRSLQNSFEYTLFNQNNYQKSDLSFKIIANQKLQSNYFNLCEAFNISPKVHELEQNYSDKFPKQNSTQSCNGNVNQFIEQASSSNAFDTENSTMSFLSHTTYHPPQYATTTHQFFDETTNIDSNIDNLPKTIQRNIHNLGDMAGEIIEYTLRRTRELCHNLSIKNKDENVIIHREALYIQHNLSLLQNVHSEIIENTECLLKTQNVSDIPHGLVAYISYQNRKILNMINMEQELLKQISLKLGN